MEPTNNPMPNTNPGGDVPPVAPVVTPPVAPVAPVPDAVGAPLVSEPSVASDVPVVPGQPAVNGAPVPPVNPVINPTPVNPVINPSGAPVNPALQSSGLGVAATDPIMMPEQPKAPDPIEEELKAPMKAAAPVPGSIGSAMSGPMGNGPVESASGAPSNMGNTFDSKTPSVAFTDPATQPEANVKSTAQGKKKTNKNTLIALAIVAVMVVIALAAVLILQLNG